MDVEELQEVEKALDEEVETAVAKQPLATFVDTLRTQTDDSLRLVVRYEAENHDVLYVRDDVREGLASDTLDERVQTLVFKALGDLPDEDALADFGSLRATVRWFDDVVVAYYPTGEWSGVVATFDGRNSPLVGSALDGLQ